eukprot:5883217-Prymnesium_polylepis.1
MSSVAPGAARPNHLLYLIMERVFCTFCHCRFAIGWNSRCTLYDKTWLTQYYEHIIDDLLNCTTSNELRPTEMSVPWLNMFATSYHWAMATMSSLPYGDGPRAHTALEYLFGVGCQVCSALSVCLHGSIFARAPEIGCVRFPAA